MKSKLTIEELELENKALKEKLAERQKILNYTSEAIYINSPDYVIEYMNKEMIKILGGDKTGQKCYKAIFDKDDVCDWCIFKELEKGKKATTEIKHPITNRHYIVNSILLDKGSKLSNYHDITSRVEIENEINKLKIAVEQSANTIVITDINGKIEYVNPKFTELTGYSAVEAIGQNPNILSTGTQPKEFYKDMWMSISQGKIWNGEFHNKKKSGEHYWESVTITPVKDESGIIKNYLAIKEDYTARKKAEEALKQSEEKFRTLFDIIPTLLDAFDEKGKCIYWNKECEKVFGWTIDEINSVDNPLSLFYPDPEIQRQVLASVTNDAKKVFKEWHPKTKSGIELTVLWANVKLNDGTIINIGHDITTLKKTEKELKESNATKDKFFSIIAHDLRSPFNATLGFSKILLKKHHEYDVKKREGIINSIYKSAESAYILLEDLLTWARSQSNKIIYKPEKLHLKIVLFEVVSGLQALADKKNIIINDTVNDNDLLFADKNMITTILRNLISNSIKFTNNGGNIHVSTKKHHYSKLLEISVIDSGVGIPKDKIEDLFRIDKNTSTPGTEDEKGTGLGLILCKEFVEKHGGSILAKSEIGEGSMFTFTIPASN